ncbi:F-box/LRR-repeat protein 3 [Lathyrus oleraceus]|uniref:F-box/LRR-repeat protein 15-like leucin rich repeat domain-containing protein n=1 Tax=Pisum sativum TaxID=3888 RepID=A0A9D4VZ08_PEA|nr:F-box/LRR-repeat protein 3-like [Pisum sativum]KAI5392276.1 hypothetical protein KIW84_076890 [Pisum sativum]
MGNMISSSSSIQTRTKTMTMLSSSSLQTRTKTVTMLSSNVYLPDECWEYIFKFLINHDTNDIHSHLKPLSIVSKQFLSVTNRLRTSLTVYNPTCQLFRRFSNISSLSLSSFYDGLFGRFSNISSLNLSSYYDGDLDDILLQISGFPLKITSLNLSNQLKIPTKGLRAFSKNITTLTSLKCSNIATLYDTDMFFIADCFPLLEELDLSHPTRFKYDKTAFLFAQDLSLALSKLRKVNLSHNYFISDELIFHLFKNCKLLQEVSITNCWGITLSGIAAALRERPTLRSFSSCYSLSWCFSDPLTSPFIHSLVSLKGLTSLNLFAWRISDELLSSIAMEGLPLTRLDLPNCKGYSYTGLFTLLSKSPRIQYLNLKEARFLNDQRVAELSLFLGDLMSIDLSRCERLTEAAMFSLVSKCPSLIEIKMEFMSIGKESVRNSNSSMDCIVNSPLKSLYLAFCKGLQDETIERFSSIFSNLQLLDLYSCQFIYDEGIDQVLRRFRNIRHLNLANCSRVDLLVGMNFELPKLEVLNLSCTTVNDETLCAISKGCRGILQLNLGNCHYVTWKGVKYVVEKCTQLREINLKNCRKVHDKFSSMLSSSPFLRKIIAPPHFSRVMDAVFTSILKVLY